MYIIETTFKVEEWDAAARVPLSASGHFQIVVDENDIAPDEIVKLRESGGFELWLRARAADYFIAESRAQFQSHEGVVFQIAEFNVSVSLDDGAAFIIPCGFLPVIADENKHREWAMMLHYRDRKIKEIADMWRHKYHGGIRVVSKK